MTLRAERLTAAYGDRFVFKDLSFNVAASETLFLSGGNGSGKTTLLQILAGLRRPLSGSVCVDEGVVSPAAPRTSSKFRSQVGFLGHDLTLYRELTVRENLELFAVGHGFVTLNQSTAAMSLIESFQLANQLDKPVGECSFGNAKKTSIVRALLHSPKFLFFDEPFSGLDKRSCEKLIAVLVEHRNSGSTLVVSSHDEELVVALMTKRIELAALQ